MGRRQKSELVKMEALEKRAKKLAEEYPGVRKVALSFSGGLESAVVGSILQECGFEVCPVVVDLGQKSDFSRIRKNATEMFGSCEHVDAKEYFIENIKRGIKANYGLRGNMNAGGLSRPAIARALVEAARRLSCQAIAHGSSGAGNDHLTMENSLRVLGPEMRIIAPVRDLDIRRDEALEFAKRRRLKTNLQRASKYSADENLWVRTIRQGEALDPTQPVEEEAYKWTVSAKDAPAKPSRVEVEFEDGVPSKAEIDGKRFFKMQEIILKLNEAGGRHGVGRLDSLDDKVVGLKAREVYECPAAQVLLAAHRQLEQITLTTKELDVKEYVELVWGRIVHDGGWYSRLRRSLDAFIDHTQRYVEGSVAISLYRGNIIVDGRKSKRALYDVRLSSQDSRGIFSQKEARQFAKLYGLQDIIAYLMESE
ncbi:MAG: argininosuccinate synthase [Candidatus Micrarchaeota archaeon]|nr:argininosuccinate synthase [Candidatus Micrarchaeota archaeon]